MTLLIVLEALFLLTVLAFVLYVLVAVGDMPDWVIQLWRDFTRLWRSPQRRGPGDPRI